MPIRLGEPYRFRDGRYYFRPINGGQLSVVSDAFGDDDWFATQRLGEIQVSYLRENRQRRPHHVPPAAELELVERGGLHTVLTLLLAPERINASTKDRQAKLKDYAGHARSALLFALDEWPGDPATRGEHTEQLFEDALQLSRADTARRVEMASALARSADFQTGTGIDGATKDNPRAIALVLRMIIRLAKEQYGIDEQALRKNDDRRLPEHIKTALAVEQDVDQILAITRQPLNSRRLRHLQQLTGNAGRLAPYHFASSYVNWVVGTARMVWLGGMPAERHQTIHQAFQAERQLLGIAGWLSAIKHNPDLLTAALLERLRVELPLSDAFDTPQQEIAGRVEDALVDLHRVCSQQPRLQKDVNRAVERAEKIMRERIFYHHKTAKHHIQHPHAQAWLPKRYWDLVEAYVPKRAIPRKSQSRRTGHRLPGMAHI